MDETRALLDALMGPNRDKKEKEHKGPLPEFVDAKVCKNFLVGFCCHDWFSTPKRKVAPCNKIHSDIIKEKFEVHPEVGPYRAEYEEDFLIYLEKVAQECDRFIAVEKGKCRPASSGKSVGMPSDIKARCNELERRYSELLSKAEDTAEKDYLAKAEMVKEELDAIKSKYVCEFAGEDICEVCGVKYPLGTGGASWHDKESHKKGKIHMGYTQIRETIVELRGKRKEWDKHKDAIKSNRRAREKEEEKQKEKQREKDRKEREKQREREEEEQREKQKEEEKQREREKEREKEREIEREKEREKEKDRGRGKSREEKDRGRGRSRDRGRKSRSGSSRRRKTSRDRERSEDADRGRKKAHKSGHSCERSRSRRRDGTAKGKAKRGDRSSDRSRSTSSDRSRSASGSPGGKSGCSVEEEDIPDFWEMVQSRPSQVRTEFVAALTSASQERLERFLLSRIAGRKA